MIVEDEPDSGELIHVHVDRDGFSRRIVLSGRVTLDEIRRTPPHLLILDLLLPNLYGLEICRRMTRDDRTRALPIVIVSARGEDSYIVSGSSSAARLSSAGEDRPEIKPVRRPAA